MSSYKDIEIYKIGFDLAIKIHHFSMKLPSYELYEQGSQVRRSSKSVKDQISEGYGRRTTPDYIRSLYIAYGSNCELETQTLLSGDLSYIDIEKKNVLLEKISEVERMLKALIKSLECKK